jgi:hypothetical protein
VSGKTNRGRSLSTKRLKTFLVIFLGFFVLSGCAALYVPDTALDVSDTKDLQTSQHSISETNNGLTVTVGLFQNEEQIKTHFGADLSKKGILPVYIRVVNNSDSAYLFLNQKIERSNASIDKQRKSAGEDDTSLILTGPLFAAFKDAEGSRERGIRYNVLTKRLKTNTLYPGEQRSGFLYFKAPRIESAAKRLTLNFLSLATKKTNKFAFIAVNKKMERGVTSTKTVDR